MTDEEITKTLSLGPTENLNIKSFTKPPELELNDTSLKRLCLGKTFAKRENFGTYKRPFDDQTMKGIASEYRRKFIQSGCLVGLITRDIIKKHENKFDTKWKQLTVLETRALNWLRKEEHCGRIYNRMKLAMLKKLMEYNLNIEGDGTSNILPTYEDGHYEFDKGKTRGECLIQARFKAKINKNNKKPDKGILMPIDPNYYLNLDFSSRVA